MTLGNSVVVHGVDLTAIRGWMDSVSLGSGPLHAVRPVDGGRRIVMLRFHRSGRDYVLRRGPAHLGPQRNEAISRECAVLRALAHTDVPHASLIALCHDTSVLDGAAFYLMEPVDGFSANLELPDAAAGTPDLRHRLCFATIDALAALGRVDHRAIGLSDFGEPEGFLERQVDRWLGKVDAYLDLPGYCEVDRPDISAIADWLRRGVPTGWRPGLVHGDFHLGNLMFRRSDPSVAAIVDWEMSAIGDPLLDLGCLLATWDLPTAPDEFAGVLTRAGGLPTAAALVARYAEQTDRDLDNLDWYTVLACFKLGIVLEGRYARAMSGPAWAEMGGSLHNTAIALLERAHHMI